MNAEDFAEKGLALTGGPGEYIFKVIPKDVQMSDDDVDGLALHGLVNYVRSRKEQITARAHESRLTCDPNGGSVDLEIGEHGVYTEAGAVVPRTGLMATTALSKDFLEIQAVFTTHPGPHQLFETLREMPHLFASSAEHASVLQTLRSTSLKLRKILEDTSSDKGERKKNLELHFDEQPPAVAWKFRASIIEGAEPIDIDAEVLWQANEEMNGVQLRVVNFRLRGIIDRAKRQAIEDAVEQIEEILGKDTIPVLWMA